MGRLDGKVAVVTGGASGIGAASVRRFLDEGACVVIADLQEAAGAELAKESGERALFIRTDVSRESNVEAAVQLALTEFGSLDCMFNNAGFGGVTGLIHKIDIGPVYDKTIAVNLTGAILGMKHAGAIMLEQGSGSIINTTSIAGNVGGMGAHVYTACKAGISGITRSVATELAPAGIRVNSISPGMIATNILAGLFTDEELSSQSATDLVRPFMSGMQPIPRAGEAIDIANMAVFLASDESSFITGQTLLVDGGASMSRQGLFELARAVRNYRRDK